MKKNKITNTRRDFLKKVCPTVAFAFFGLSFIESCSAGDSDDNYGIENGETGYTSSGGVFTIDLSNSNFSTLNSVGGWMNGYNIGLNMLFLRISNDHIQAYSNSCPHNGVRNRWELIQGNNFRCNQHGNIYNSSCVGGNALTCYSTNIDGNNLIVAT